MFALYRSLHSLILFLSGHSDITGNCKAYEMTRKGTLAPLSVEWECVGAPISSCVLLLYNWASRELDHRWATIGSCAVARFFWSKIDRKRSSEVFVPIKASICLVVGVLTGHCPDGVHAVRFTILPDVCCRSRMEDDEVELTNTSLLIVPRLRHQFLH